MTTNYFKIQLDVKREAFLFFDEADLLKTKVAYDAAIMLTERTVALDVNVTARRRKPIELVSVFRDFDAGDGVVPEMPSIIGKNRELARWFIGGPSLRGTR